MRRWMLTALATAVSAGGAQAGTAYAVHWTAVEHMLTPTAAITTHNWVDRLSVDGDTITTYANGAQATTASGQAALFTTPIGTPYRVVTTVNGASIRQVFTFAGFTERVSIRPGGATGCRADVRYAKASGRGVFSARLLDGSGSSTASRVEAANVSCQATAR